MNSNSTEVCLCESIGCHRHFKMNTSKNQERRKGCLKKKQHFPSQHPENHGRK